MLNLDMALIGEMMHSPVDNYVIPGLTSWLIGAKHSTGLVRVFQNTRDHQETIAPHSHRFDFTAIVLEGGVTNRIWTPSENGGGDAYTESSIEYAGEIGKYKKIELGSDLWVYEDTSYYEGDCYSMTKNQIHSIFFKRNTTVLMFEGASSDEPSSILEPCVGGRTIPTGAVMPWMFKKR